MLSPLVTNNDKSFGAFPQQKQMQQRLRPPAAQCFTIGIMFFSLKVFFKNYVIVTRQQTPALCHPHSPRNIIV